MYTYTNRNQGGLKFQNEAFVIAIRTFESVQNVSEVHTEQIIIS